MNSLKNRIDRLDNKKRETSGNMYYVTGEVDPETITLCEAAQDSDPVFRKQYLCIGVKLLKLSDKYDAKYGRHVPWLDLADIDANFRELYNDFIYVIEAKTGRSLFTFPPNWETQQENENCFPKDRLDYWRAKKLSEYESI